MAFKKIYAIIMFFIVATCIMQATQSSKNNKKNKKAQARAQRAQIKRERCENCQSYNRPSMYFNVGFPDAGWGGYGYYPACDYSWPYNTGYGYNCGNWGYYTGYPAFGFGINIPL